jgi:DNA excision repair protein ERCC-2
VHAQVPSPLASALQDVVAALGDHVAERPDAVDAELLQWWFDALLFTRLLETLDAQSQFDVTIGTRGDDSTLCVRNVVPARFLKQRFDAAHCSVLFSATLSPAAFYMNTLGLPDGTAWVDVESPFRADQLDIRIVSDISTRYANRDRSLAPIAGLIAAQYESAPGNYLAFFSSYDYMDSAADALARQHAALPVWVQARGASEAEREAFLGRFREGGRGIGFAVLGGAFAEGIDLPGSRLIGAFIATLGLPQVNPVNEQLRIRMESLFGAGFDYTYLYPGLRKVVQAAGRVVRTETDRGTVFLIDERFARRQTLDLLPRWWQPVMRPHTASLDR